MRKLTVPVVLMSALGFSGSSLASPINLHKHGAEEIKAVCAKAGGKYSEGAGTYACGTNCHGGPGTDCVVFCKADQMCEAQVIGARRPTTPLSALQAQTRANR